MAWRKSGTCSTLYFTRRGAKVGPIQACVSHFSKLTRICADCEVAMPKVMAMLSGTNHLLVKVDVGHKDSWLDRAHPLRMDHNLLLTCIPSLFQWGSKGAGARLVDWQCQDDVVLYDFVAGGPR